MARWRLIVLPLVAALSIAALWIPIPVTEDTTIHAKAATLTLSIQTSGKKENAVGQDTATSAPSLPKAELPPVAKQEKEIPKETGQTGQTKEAETSPSVPLPPKTLSFRREVAGQQQEEPKEASPRADGNRKEEEKSAIQEESNRAEEPTLGGTAYSTIEEGMTVPQFDMGAISRKIVYPPMAKRKRIEGDAMLQLYLSREGEIDKIVILSQDEYGFGEAAKAAFAGIKGKPAMKDGKSIAVTLRFPVHFALR